MNTFSINHKCTFIRKNNDKKVHVSVVIPVLNELDNICELHRGLSTVLKKMGIGYEILYVDDGSTDGSLRLLKKIARQNPAVKIISFRRNYGQTPAMAAGFKYARGEIVVAMDADLQNDPRDIPSLVERIYQGADVVSGWRRNRQDDTLKRKIPSVIANWFVNKLISGTGVHLHDYGCTLKAYRREVVQNIKLYGEMHRFIPAFAAWLGVKVEEIEVRHHPRKQGNSKYGLSRITRVLLDFVTVRFFSDYMTHPIQFFGKIAMGLVSLGIFSSAFIGTLGYLLGWHIDLNTLVIMNLVTVIMGTQFIFLGLLGEIQMRAYFESQDKDPYYIREIINGSQFTGRKTREMPTDKKVKNFG
jgi:glycosyltransferase involved in cell wall biosynthesis